MRNLSDNDIDKLFIEAAANHQPPFDAADWRALESKLNKHPRFSYKAWLGILIFSGIVFTAAWTGFTRWNAGPGLLSQTNRNEIIQRDPSITTPSLPQPDNTRTEVAGKDSTSHSIKINPSVTDRNQSTTHFKPTMVNQGVVPARDQDSNSFTASEIYSLSSSSNQSMQILQNADTPSADTLTRKRTLTDSTMEKQPTARKPDVEEKEKHPLYRFAVRAMVSPDYTSDQFKKADKTGFNYGFDFHYFITPEISLSTGVIRSRKYYTAEGAEYGGLEAEDLSGDCYMWDIPLNVRYTFAPSRKLTGFISTGLTSYLLSDENYSFQVETGYGGRQQYTMNVKDGNNEWFSMVNVSLGLQQRFSDRFTIQLEPFAKIPLAGIGEGNIQLSSVGCFFAVEYRFGIRSSTSEY